MFRFPRPRRAPQATAQRPDGDPPSTLETGTAQLDGGPAPAQLPAGIDPSEQPDRPSFAGRGRLRRRLRYLRRARELALRDLGGFVFDLQRFGGKRPGLLGAKLTTLREIDTELRTLERVLNDRRAFTVLREPGIRTCPRCATIHGSDGSFCPGCGLQFHRHVQPALPGASAAVPALGPATLALVPEPDPHSQPSANAAAGDTARR